MVRGAQLLELVAGQLILKDSIPYLHQPHAFQAGTDSSGDCELVEQAAVDHRLVAVLLVLLLAAMELALFDVFLVQDFDEPLEVVRLLASHSDWYTMRRSRKCSSYARMNRAWCAASWRLSQNTSSLRWASGRLRIRTRDTWAKADELPRLTGVSTSCGP